MTSRPGRHTSNPDKEALHHAIRALPLIQNDAKLLDEKSALATLAHLKATGSAVPERLEAHYSPLMQTITQELPRDPARDNALVVTERQLRGIIARAVITGASQVAYDIGANLRLTK